jgi:type III secretion protein J
VLLSPFFLSVYFLPVAPAVFLDLQRESFHDIRVEEPMIKRFCSFLLVLIFLTGCEGNQAIVSNVEEREANEIIVYLASKGINAQKVQAPATETATLLFYSINVDSDRAVDAMSILNKVGLPRRSGTNLLTLFAKSGLMSSDKEETIRYQAGLAEELKNTIRKIDGVLEADVQLSFPTSETIGPGGVPPKITAAVYIKHQGVLDDPNSHMETKIKRLLSGSVNGLTYENVIVVSDRSRFTDITLTPEGEPIGSSSMQENYVSIWGLVLTKSSLARFRTIFFIFILLIALLCAAIGWAIWKYYPQIRNGQKPPEAPEEPPAT